MFLWAILSPFYLYYVTRREIPFLFLPYHLVCSPKKKIGGGSRRFQTSPPNEMTLNDPK